MKHDTVISDAGIIEYKDTSLIVVTLSFNARDSIRELYGKYDVNGDLVGAYGLIGNLLEEKGTVQP